MMTPEPMLRRFSTGHGLLAGHWPLRRMRSARIGSLTCRNSVVAMFTTLGRTFSIVITVASRRGSAAAGVSDGPDANFNGTLVFEALVRGASAGAAREESRHAVNASRRAPANSATDNWMKRLIRLT